MNWLGLSFRAFAAALTSCLIGFFVYGYVVRATGAEAPWMIGLLAGGATALASSTRSTMRGLIIGTLALWTAAAAQAYYTTLVPGGIVNGLVELHATLTLARFAQFTVCALLAIGLGGLAVSPRRRMAGT